MASSFPSLPPLLNQFLRTPIAPLNIAHKPVPPPTLATPSSLPVEDSSRSALEGNVRILCDMVDTVLKSSRSYRDNTHVDCQQIRIDIHPFDQDMSCVEPQYWKSASSPLCILSPRAFDLTKTNISKIDSGDISQLNSDTLLALFPAPPQSTLKTRPSTSTSSSSSTSASTASVKTNNVDGQLLPPQLQQHPEPTVCDTRVSLGPPHPQPRKLSKNRNWVITSGLFVTPPTEDGQGSYFRPIPGLAHLGDITSEWEPMKSETAAEDTYRLLSSSLSPSTSSPSPPDSPSDHTGSPVGARLDSDNEKYSVDDLSQRLWDIEIQMRRPSFLMSHKRSSILSTMLPYNTIIPESMAADEEILPPVEQQERLLAELSLTVGTIIPAAHHESLPFLTNSKHTSDSHDTASFLTELPAEDMGNGDLMDWRAWHGQWTRRRMHSKPPSSPTNSSINSRTAYSDSIYLSSNRCSISTNGSTTCPSPTTSTATTSTTASCISTSLNRRPRKFLSLPLSPASANSAPPVSPMDSKDSGMPTKDANPQLWESEGLKWGDRFQSLMHNFQSSAGKRSKRFMDILPKSRWSSNDNGNKNIKRFLWSSPASVLTTPRTSTETGASLN
ncbi:hypothetical protein EDD11_002872 [Mortierella claussenii]|nr:hypothetical protein EDD11_002872 [Mortierella claussenii]